MHVKKVKGITLIAPQSATAAAAALLYHRQSGRTATTGLDL